MKIAVTNDLPYWLALWRTPGIGPVSFFSILDNYADIKSYFDQNKSIEIHWKLIETDLKWAEASHHHIITYKDTQYPLRLKEITSPPPLLFVEGDITLLSEPQIAMVGSRHPTAGGCDIAYQFAKTFAQHHWIITSGLALGIDSASHEGALDAKGKTIAVMGTGPDQIYPKRHQALARKISENGCLVTEFPTGVTPVAMNFPRRNRIISGLSYGVLVVEAAYASGSLVTAKYALEQNREVFAIPGSIQNPLARGCHALIKQGAKLVETSEDVLEELALYEHPLCKRGSPEGRGDLRVRENPPTALQSAPFFKGGVLTTDNMKNIHPLLSYIDFNATPIDLIIERSGKSADEVSVILLTLELEGHIQSVPGGYLRIK